MISALYMELQITESADNGLVILSNIVLKDVWLMLSFDKIYYWAAFVINKLIFCNLAHSDR